jgi:hypothetical protein
MTEEQKQRIINLMSNCPPFVAYPIEGLEFGVSVLFAQDLLNGNLQHLNNTLQALGKIAIELQHEREAKNASNASTDGLASHS